MEQLQVAMQEMTRLKKENEELRNLHRETKINSSYQRGITILDQLDEDVEKFRRDIQMGMGQCMKDTAYLGIKLREIEDNPLFYGGDESAERRMYVSRKEAINRKIENLHKAIKLMLMAMED